ncbi:MAG TPA: ADP-glyceromanno-heptose 6-epimerase [Caulobacteraceae bacterium]
MTRRIVFVTGGAGFIGSNIAARLAEDRHLDVVVCDRLRQADAGKWRNLAKHPLGDFVQPEEMWDWLEKRWRDVELVIHTAAISSTLESDADKIVSTNFGLSRDLFRWCADRQRRMIYASSAATYGDGSQGFDDSQEWEALAALRPLNAYGWSKALFDVFAVRQAARGYAPPQWAGLKFFNVYGPNEEHKGVMRSVASQIWPDVAAGRTVKLFRSYHPDYPHGGQKRDFVYVRDVVDVVAWLHRNEAVNGVFNLGSGQARSFRELAEALFAAAGQQPRIEYIEMPKALRERYQYFTEARTDRLRQAGYAPPMTSLEDGVGDYVSNYLSQADPYR